MENLQERQVPHEGKKRKSSKFGAEGIDSLETDRKELNKKMRTLTEEVGILRQRSVMAEAGLKFLAQKLTNQENLTNGLKRQNEMLIELLRTRNLIDANDLERLTHFVRESQEHVTDESQEMYEGWRSPPANESLQDQRGTEDIQRNEPMESNGLMTFTDSNELVPWNSPEDINTMDVSIKKEEIDPFSPITQLVIMTNSSEKQKQLQSIQDLGLRTCQECPGSHFRNPLALRRHAEARHQQVACSSCVNVVMNRKLYVSDGSYEAHLAYHRPTQFQCLDCHWYFASNDALRKHAVRETSCKALSKLHRTKSCTECPENETTNSYTPNALRRHAELSHQSIECSACVGVMTNKSLYISDGSYESHLMYHVETDYQCYDCKWYFGSPDALRKHLTRETSCKAINKVFSAASDPQVSTHFLSNTDV